MKQVIIFLLIILSFNAFSNAPKTSIPYIVDFQITDYADLKIIGKELSKNPLTLYFDMFYNRTNLKLNFTFPVSSVFKAAFMFQDRVEVRLNYKNISQDDSDTILWRLRNRFYMQVDNNFNIYDKLNIGYNLEYRVAYDLAPNKISNQVENRLTPAIKFSGKYDFGLNWSIYERFPIYIDATSELIVQAIDVESYVDISYNFFKLSDSIDSKYTLELLHSNFLCYTKDYKKDSIDYYYFEFFLGLKSKINDASLFICPAFWYNDYRLTEKYLLAGFKIGGSYKINDFELGVSYSGAMNQLEGSSKDWNSLLTLSFGYKISKKVI